MGKEKNKKRERTCTSSVRWEYHRPALSPWRSVSPPFRPPALTSSNRFVCNSIHLSTSPGAGNARNPLTRGGLPPSPCALSVLFALLFDYLFDYLFLGAGSHQPHHRIYIGFSALSLYPGLCYLMFLFSACLQSVAFLILYFFSVFSVRCFRRGVLFCPRLSSYLVHSTFSVCPVVHNICSLQPPTRGTAGGNYVQQAARGVWPFERNASHLPLWKKNPRSGISVGWIQPSQMCCPDARNPTAPSPPLQLTRATDFECIEYCVLQTLLMRSVPVCSNWGGGRGRTRGKESRVAYAEQRGVKTRARFCLSWVGGLSQLGLMDHLCCKPGR